MKMISKATKRIMGRDVRRPPFPVEARDAYPTMVFSMEDQTPPASERLLDVALEAVKLAVAGGVELDDIARRPDVPEWFGVWPGEHYLLLAAMMKVLRPRRVIEIGTFTGLSALAMKKYLPPEGKIVTFDLRAWRTVAGTALREADFADGRLAQELDDLGEAEAFEKHRSLLEEAEFFFIDGPKDNVFEYSLVAGLRSLAVRHRPILLFDDTRLWSMLRFWRMLPLPKLDLTSFGSWSGTGLAELAG